MAENSKIEWTEKTWNPLAGCSLASPGCTNCYAMKMAHRLAAMGHKKYAGTTQVSLNRGPIWTGKINVDSDAVMEPFRWKKPARIFVNSMSDLFHKDVPFEFIDQTFAVMYSCHFHTFQVLTKRPERIAEYCASNPLPRIAAWAMRHFQILSPVNYSEGLLRNVDILQDLIDVWPCSNIWLGTSVESQKYVGRIEELRRCQAAVRFVSFEPLLSHVTADLSGIHWAIVGGESGPHARPMHPDWARSIRDQCAAAGVPYFFKQWGEWAPLHGIGRVYGDEEDEIAPYTWISPSGRLSKSGVEPDAVMIRVGKKASGRMLDFSEWNEFPVVIS